MPNRARNVSVIAALAAENRGFLNSFMSSIGCVERSSQTKKRGEDQGTHAEGGEHRRRRPALLRRLDDRPQDRAEADDRQDRADGVEPGLGRVLRLGDQEVAGDEADDHDGHVDEEDRAPPEVGEQGAAGDRAHAEAERRDAGPDADGLAALVGVAEDVGQDRERRRHDERAADAHDRPGDDQHRRAAGERRQRRAHAEHREAEGQALVATEAVTHAAGGEQQPGEHDRVAVDDPLQLALRGVEPTLVRSALASVGRATLRIVLSRMITMRLTHSTSSTSHRLPWT